MSAPTPDTNQPESDKELRQKLASIIYLKDYHEGEMLNTPRINKLVELLVAECQAARIDELEGLERRREFPVANHGTVTDIEGNERSLIQIASGSWENAIKLRLKALRSASRKEEQ